MKNLPIPSDVTGALEHHRRGDGRLERFPTIGFKKIPSTLIKYKFIQTDLDADLPEWCFGKKNRTLVIALLHTF